MKKYLHLIILLISLFTFGQQTYKVTEGELQFIHEENGIVVKKEQNYYILKKKYNFELDNNDNNSIYKFELEKLSNSEFEEYSKSISTISVSDVVQLKPNIIKNIRFIETTEYDFNQFYYLNHNMFVYSKSDLESNKEQSKELYPFLILNFNNNKQIIYFEDGFIVPLKKGLKLLLQNKFISSNIEAGIKLKASEIDMGHFSDINQYYEIDTIKSNKKVFLKSMFFTNVLKKTYDSIYTNRNFIVGYDKKKIDVYNYQFQKLALKKIKAIYLEKYFPKAQIISKNYLVSINLLGQEYKKGDGPSFIDLSFQFPDQDLIFKIVKENNNYYWTGDIGKLQGNSSQYSNEKIKLYNTTDIDSLEFTNNDHFNFITLYTESGYSKKRPILIYSFLKNKKYNLNTIEYFLNENLDSEKKDINDALPKNVDLITKIDNDIYLIKKDDLYTYYPIKKEIKYKTIGKFQGNFARFELPNGKKGWLSKDGKEYLDD
jgi:hypothetical protein